MNENSLTKIRVAAVQLEVIGDVAANLATCCRMIDEAASAKPDLIVLPEFCNHLAWYTDRDHSYEVAVSLDGEFLGKIGQKAAEHHCYIMINCTVRRADKKVTGTNCLFDPNGRLIATSDKQVLMGNENNFLEKATENCDIIPLPFGDIGMYSCMDGVTFETSRGMSVRGAQLLLNSLNSFAKDEASLHIPVRAVESKVFVVAACKVGALVPPEMTKIVADRLKISPEQLRGDGHSQIVAPDGTVMAMLAHDQEGFVVADIDLSEADNKLRPDGTHVMAARRPELYRQFLEEPQPRQFKRGDDEVVTAVYQPKASGMAAVEEVGDMLPTAVAQQAKMVVLPELFFLENGLVDDVATGVAQSQQALAVLQTVLQAVDAPLHVVTTIVEQDEDGAGHTAVLLSKNGIELRQPQLHASARHDWVTQLGDGVATIDLDWGRVALVAGNDSIYPETFRLGALQDVQVTAVSTHIQEKWELALGLPERAAENRMSVLVGSRPTPLMGGSAIFTIDEDFTLWTEWKKRPFDGNINNPIVNKMSELTGLLTATIYPNASENRVISQKTDVVGSRPWWLAEALM